MNILKITDWNQVTCKLVNHMRYALQFMSVYLFVIFVIQRLLTFYRPLPKRIATKTKGYAWKIVVSISLIAVFLSSWTPFVYHLKEDTNDKKHCSVNKKYKAEYFVFNSVFNFIVIFLPLLIIFLANCLIKINNKNSTSRNQTHLSLNRKIEIREKKQNDSVTDLDDLNLTVKRWPRKNTILIKIKPHYFTKDQQINMNSRRSSKKSDISLLLILFSFVILNFPYLIIWSVFYYNLEFLNVHQCHFSIGLQMGETFSLLYYVGKFIILVFIGSMFRRFLNHQRNISL